MIEPKSFRYSEQNRVATITLDRPERLNALTFEVYRELTDTFRALQNRREVGCVVITGAGRGFCSGGDVKDIIGQLMNRDMAALLEFTRMTCELVGNIRALRKPVIASLNGVVAGAGAMIAIASDLRIATPAARIAFLFVKVGLSGADMGAAFLLPRIIGLSKATELLYSGEFLAAADAERLGLYNRLVAQEELTAETQRWAEQLAAGPGFGIAITKEMLNQELNMRFAAALEAEAQAQAICMQHPDYQEAHRAFLEKRQPDFQK